MASSKRTFRMFVEEELGIFPHFLVWAVLEWMLIISLYVDGFLTFFSNKFADTFELDPPCVLCTRVDHALCGKNPNLYYNESICDSHKKDISSLAYCHVHRKLSDIRTMCESCLLSFAIENDSDSDSSKERDEDDYHPQEKNVKNGSKHDGVKVIDPNACSCCGEFLKPKQPSKDFSRSLSSLRSSSLLQSASPRVLSLFTASSPRAFSSLAPPPSPRASSSMLPPASPRTFSSLFPTSSPRAFSSFAPMCSPRAFSSHTRFTELKFVNDNEPDIPDDNDNTNRKQMNEDADKTSRSNKFFGIPLTESAVVNSPKWAVKPPKKATLLEKQDLVSETNEEDECSLVQLKKQVSDNRKTLLTLYMELDEERSAATVAANNAMAMITRLQAEKAGVHMEALQYQRMMDEQAEYDEEAIQILKDLLLKKEDDVKIMDAQLQAYRSRYGLIKKPESDEYDEYFDDLQPRSFGDTDDHNVEGNKKGNLEESSSDYETERSQLFGMLKDIENQIRLSSKQDHHQDNIKDDGDNAALRREVNVLREKLAAIEAESGFLKHTAMALGKGDEGTKLLTEVAEHLRRLQS